MTNITEPRVFVGIRTCNDEEFISKSFKSVNDQSYKNIKVVVYDDASTDKSRNYVKIWSNKFANRGIESELIEGAERKGCGGAFESLGRAVAAQMRDDDIFVMLDSDDNFTTPDAIERAVNKLKSDNANICISGFNIVGDKSLTLNQQGGLPHNLMADRLSKSGGVSVSDIPQIASDVDSIGWTKVVKGDIFKRYMSIYSKDVSPAMKVCEDFPTLAMLLFKDAKITGVEKPMYDYFKHQQSSTTKVCKEDFSVVRLGWLESLQNMWKDHKELFIDGADKYINNFLSTKYNVISNIVNMKHDQMPDYSVTDFQNDFRKRIDCSELNLPPKSLPLVKKDREGRE